jgi:hypothetical protein
VTRNAKLSKAINKIYRSSDAESNQYFSILMKFVKNCANVAVIGTPSFDATFVILKGLENNSSSSRSLWGIHPDPVDQEKLCLAQTIADQIGVDFQFQQISDFDTSLLQPVDLCEINLPRTYQHLSYDIESYSYFVRHRILIRRTKLYEVTNSTDDQIDASRYPPHIDRTKQGLRLAIEEFLSHHPEWNLYAQSSLGDGFTLINRNRCLSNDFEFHW